MRRERQTRVTTPDASSPRAPAASRAAPSLAYSAQLGPTTSSSDNIGAHDHQSGPTVRHFSAQPAAPVQPGASHQATWPHVQTRALTSSERGRRFRLREKTHEQSLLKQINAFHEQIAQLERSRDLLKQRSLMTRTSSGGSLEKIVRELYAIYRFGLESPSATAESYSEPQGDLASLVASKEDFLRRVVEHDVMCGDFVGVDALLDQWRKHTLSYAKFEIEVDHVEPIAGSKANPIVVIHTKLHTRFSRESISMMFPGVLEYRPELVAKFIDRDISFDCISRFTFNERDQITTYLVSMNTVEALVKAVGSARDVSELMAFSVVTPSMAIRDPEPYEHSSSYDRLHRDHGDFDVKGDEARFRDGQRSYASNEQIFSTYDY